MKRTLLLLLTSLIAVPLFAAPEKLTDVFYVYSDKGARVNHFIPSGYMGDYQDIVIDEKWSDNCKSGTCLQVRYDAKMHQGAGWAGVFWQHPANNWGEKAGGFDLGGYKRLKFWARGAKGGETINEFKIGGITGEHGDSDAASIGPIMLSEQWKEYTIELKDTNLSHIIGGFCWAAAKDVNPDGFVFFLDDIRFEK